MPRLSPCAVAVAAAVSTLGQSADAAVVSFTGTVVNLCVLTVSTPGILGLSADGKTLSSSETGGVKAIMAVVSAGTNPTIAFTAPTISGPAGAIGGSTTTMGFASPGGATQSHTGSATTYQMNRLLDTLTIDAQATNPAGFATGLYTVATTATCQQ